MVIINQERKKEFKVMRLGKYELGKTLGEGNFGKVKLARNTDSGHFFAVKILEKNKIVDLNNTDQVCSFFDFVNLKLLFVTKIDYVWFCGGWNSQIKREISTLKLLKHPNVVRLYEVMS